MHRISMGGKSAKRTYKTTLCYLASALCAGFFAACAALAVQLFGIVGFCVRALCAIAMCCTKRRQAAKKAWQGGNTAEACVLRVLCVGSSLSRACAVGCISFHGMMFFQLVLQIIKIIRLVTFGAAYILMPCHVLHLS